MSKEGFSPIDPKSTAGFVNTPEQSNIFHRIADAYGAMSQRPPAPTTDFAAGMPPRDSISPDSGTPVEGQNNS